MNKTQANKGAESLGERNCSKLIGCMAVLAQFIDRNIKKTVTEWLQFIKLPKNIPRVSSRSFKI